MRRANVFKVISAGAMLVALAGPAASATSHGTEHASAAGALGDIKAAIASIIHAENATSSGPDEYKAAAQRAINALVGEQDPAFVAKLGNPGDAAGVIGHVNHLLDRIATPPWVPALHGVLVNTQAAVGHLQDALRAGSLSKFEVAASRALENLEMAQGRTDEYDALGGMAGALANTELAVPAGATMLDGCMRPRKPGYGVYQGYLVYQAVSLDNGGTLLTNPGGRYIKRNGNMLIFYTAAAPVVQQHCAEHAVAATVRTTPALVKVAQARAQARPSTLIKATNGAIYTTAQAKQGEAIYTQSCASCHGTNLQGVAAPAIAGKDFLGTAQKNGWTIGILRTIVTENMPFNNPGSLTAGQYAEVLAYLLAANCYPAGTTPFPEHATANLAHLKITEPSHLAGTPDRFGVCSVVP